MKKKVAIGVFGILGALYGSCQKPDWDLPPNRFYYQITKDGQHLSDTVLNNLKFYYIDNAGVKVYRDPNTDNEAANHILLPSWIAGNESLDQEGVRLCMEINSFGVYHPTWYFEFPDGDIDTLYVEAVELSKKKGREDPCYCVTPFSVVRFNGEDANISSTLKAADGKNVYILEK